VSLSGGLSRTLTLCSARWERRIKEHKLELAPGWRLTIELPFIDVDVDSYGWGQRHREQGKSLSLSKRLLRTPSLWRLPNNGLEISWAGFSASFQTNTNTGELIEEGDFRVE